jgi:hypothetical protein
VIAPTDVLAIHRPTAILTERGTAVMLVYRLLAALRCLDADERADCLELLELEIAEGALD